MVEQKYPGLAKRAAMLEVRAESLAVWNTRRATIIAQQDTNLKRWQIYAESLAKRLGTASRDAHLLSEIRRLEVQKQGVEDQIARRSQAGAYGNSDAISAANKEFIQQLTRQAENLQTRILGLQEKLLL